MSEYPKVFICEDCGSEVVSWRPMPTANDENFCLQCAWLRDHVVEPEQRDRLREMLRLVKPT